MHLLPLATVLTACGDIGSIGDDEPGAGRRSDRDETRDGSKPVVSDVRISPTIPYVDGPVSCRADYGDDDGGHLEAEYTWRNSSRDVKLGTGADIVLHPDDISPGETLTCAVSVTDADGNLAAGDAQVSPGCGFYDPASLGDVSFVVDILFRPYITDEVIPGYEGAPWDWDGDVPDWILDVVGIVSDVLDVGAYLDPTLMTAAEAADVAEELLWLIEEYGPELMEPYVPPDPDVYPYVFDSEGTIYTYWDDSAGIQWEDSYEVAIEVPHEDFYTYDGIAFDLEDIDLAFDDNMGDWLDQGDDPLILAWPVFSDGAYCTTVYANPTHYAQSSDSAYVPSSILWMSIEVW